MLSSFSNPLIKRIKRLRQTKYRRQENAFYVEGLRTTLSAIEHQAQLEVVVTCPALLSSTVAQKAVHAYQAAGGRVVEMTAPLFRSISERDRPVGLGAIIHTNWSDFDTWSVSPSALFLALVGISDPGNLGAIIRSMDAVNATGLILVGATTDPFHPTAVKASMGTVFTCTLSRAPELTPIWSWAQANGIGTVATSARAPHLYRSAPYPRPTLLLMGSEREGLPASALNTADLAVSIPMSGNASSLNLAVATGLILYEIVG